MKKRLFTTALIVLVAALTLGCFTACCGDADYFANLAEYGFWANDPEEAIAQPKIGQLVRDFLDSPLPDGKSEQTMRGCEFSCPCLLYEKTGKRKQRRRSEKPIFELPRICIDQFVIDNLKGLPKEQFDKQNHGVLRGKPKIASMKIRAQFAMQTRAD